MFQMRKRLKRLANGMPGTRTIWKRGSRTDASGQNEEGGALMPAKFLMPLLLAFLFVGCATDMQSKHGSFKGSFGSELEARRDIYTIQTVGNDHGGTALVSMMLVGIPIIVPTVQTKGDLTIDEAIQETCRAAFFQDGQAEAFRVSSDPDEIRIVSSIYFRQGMNKIMRIEVIHDRQKLNPGDVRLFSNWREYTIDGHGIRIVRENIPDSAIRDLLSSETDREKSRR